MQLLQQENEFVSAECRGMRSSASTAEKREMHAKELLMCCSVVLVYSHVCSRSSAFTLHKDMMLSSCNTSRLQYSMTKKKRRFTDIMILGFYIEHQYRP